MICELSQGGVRGGGSEGQGARGEGLGGEGAGLRLGRLKRGGREQGSLPLLAPCMVQFSALEVRERNIPCPVEFLYTTFERDNEFTVYITQPVKL
jgi:hypothetical protein